MRKSTQDGSTSVVVAILMTLLFLAAAGFGGWAFMGMQDYKNNSDQKSAQAVAAAEKVQETKLRQEFAEDYKNPNKTYKSASVLGTITFKYPKTWSAYINSNNSSQPLDGYFHPDFVPSAEGDTAYALRMELLSDDFSNVMQGLEQEIERGELEAKAFVPKNMRKVGGIKPGSFLTGFVSESDSKKRQGAMLIIPIRGRTLKIYTESPGFVNDFNKIVIPSLTFKP